MEREHRAMMRKSERTLRQAREAIASNSRYGATSSGGCNVDELDERSTARAELATAVAEHDAAVSAMLSPVSPCTPAQADADQVRLDRARNRVIRAAQALAYLGI